MTIKINKTNVLKRFFNKSAYYYYQYIPDIKSVFDSKDTYIKHLNLESNE